MVLVRLSEAEWKCSNVQSERKFERCEVQAATQSNGIRKEGKNMFLPYKRFKRLSYVAKFLFHDVTSVVQFILLYVMSRGISYMR